MAALGALEAIGFVDNVGNVELFADLTDADQVIRGPGSETRCGGEDGHNVLRPEDGHGVPHGDQVSLLLMGDDGGLQAGSQDALETGLLVDPRPHDVLCFKSSKVLFVGFFLIKIS